MAEVAFEGDYQNEFRDDEWGLDGWSNRDRFVLIASNEFGGGRVDLNEEQCSMLMAALEEHLKELKDARKENPS